MESMDFQTEILQSREPGLSPVAEDEVDMDDLQVMISCDKSNNLIGDPTGSIRMDVGSMTTIIVIIRTDAIIWAEVIITIRLVMFVWKMETIIDHLIGRVPNCFTHSIDRVRP
jgi:hypothetical protein